MAVCCLLGRLKTAVFFVIVSVNMICLRQVMIQTVSKISMLTLGILN